MKHLYFLVLFCSVIVPFAFSFHPKLTFYKYFKPAIITILIVSCPFILWDMCFTSMHVWGFTPQYISGIFMYNLPLEEILFFICIPFCSLFTYHALKVIFKREYSVRSMAYGCILAGIFLLLAGFIHWEQLYTRWVFLLAGSTLTLLGLQRPSYLYASLISYLILLLPFFIVNGILTGTGLENPVVWYEHTEIIGIRILTIPLEDFFYGMILILWNIIVFEISVRKMKFVR